MQVCRDWNGSNRGMSLFIFNSVIVWKLSIGYKSQAEVNDTKWNIYHTFNGFICYYELYMS